MTNLNDGIKNLSFCNMGQSHLVHFVDPLTSLRSTVIDDGFEVDISPMHLCM